MPEAAPQFADDAARLRVLESFEPDALEDDPELRAIVGFAARLCNVPAAQVTLVEELRQRFIAGEGLEERETPREVSFCNIAMRQNTLMEVRDATTDQRFNENGLVVGPPGIRFYAGQPLVSEEGAPLGALCVVDLEPHPEGLNSFQREGMAVLAQAVMRRLNARRANIVAERELRESEERLRRVLEGVPQIAWSADAEGNFDYFNARWKQQVGTEPPRVAEDWRPVIHPDDAETAFADWHNSLGRGQEYEAEFRMLQADGSYRWVLGLAVPVTDAESKAVRWFGTVTDIDEVHRALEERDMLANELSHRIKNIFAVVIGLASLKVKKTPEHEPFAHELIDVLRALGRAHEFVRPESSIVQDSLQGVLTALFEPYALSKDVPRILIAGDDASISPRSATPLALVFHELATNSAKYGSLSVDSGHVTLTIKDTGQELALTWQEHGGPKVSAGGRPGFGTRLVEMSITGQLDGSLERDFRESGLVAALTISKAALAG